jgi:hypothetical protein
MTEILFFFKYDISFYIIFSLQSTRNVKLQFLALYNNIKFSMIWLKCQMFCKLQLDTVMKPNRRRKSYLKIVAAC